MLAFLRDNFNYQIIDMSNRKTEVIHKIFKISHHNNNLLIFIEKNSINNYIFENLSYQTPTDECGFIIGYCGRVLTIPTASNNKEKLVLIKKFIINEKECCICFEEETSSIICKQCGNYTCHNCLHNMLKNNPELFCPVCKRPIKYLLTS